jgi:NADH:ubiquinone oxidoreductase subunit C
MEQLAIQEKLSAAFGDQVGEWHAMKGSAYATKFGSYLDVKNVDYLRDVCLYMRDQPELQFDNLMLLSTLDNGDKTLSAVYHLESTVHRHVFALKVTVSVSCSCAICDEHLDECQLARTRRMGYDGDRVHRASRPSPNPAR